jgi:hypothetical protein
LCRNASTEGLPAQADMSMQAVRGLSMEKWLCWGSAGVAGLMLFLFVLDLVAGVPFGRTELSGMMMVDILGALMSALLVYLSWDALRGIG